MSQLSTKLKKYGLLATGITGAAVSAQAQVEYTEVNDIFEDDRYTNTNYDLNDDQVEDINVYRSNYTSTNSLSTYTYSYIGVNNRSQADYVIQFTGMISEGTTVDENLSFQNYINEYQVNPNDGDEFYFGFRIVERTCGIAIPGDQVFFAEAARTKKPGECTLIPTGNDKYGWMKFTYDSFEVETDQSEGPISVAENEGPGDVFVLTRKATEIKTGFRLDGYAIENTYNKSIEVGDDGSVTSISQPLSASDIGINIYPNPTSDVVKIDGDIQSVSLLDFSGQTVLESTNTEISLENLASGIYVLKIDTNEGTFTEKIQKL